MSLGIELRSMDIERSHPSEILLAVYRVPVDGKGTESVRIHQTLASRFVGYRDDSYLDGAVRQVVEEFDHVLERTPLGNEIMEQAFAVRLVSGNHLERSPIPDGVIRPVLHEGEAVLGERMDVVHGERPDASLAMVHEDEGIVRVRFGFLLQRSLVIGERSVRRKEPGYG